MARKGLKSLMFDDRGGKNLLIKKEFRDKYRDIWPFSQFAGREAINVFRFLPTKYCEDDGQEVLSPYRLSNEPRDFGAWIYPAVVASIGGRQGITFIMGSRETDDELSIREKPYYVLYNNARRLLANHVYPHWRKFNLIQGFCADESVVPKLIRPEIHYFVFGLVLHHPLHKYNGHYLGSGESEPLHVVVLRRALGERMLDICDAPVNVQPDFDPISLDKGKLALIYRSSSAQYQGFDITFKDQFQNTSARLSDLAETITKKLAFWDVLHFPTVEEQVEYICQSPLPPEVIDRCLGETFGYLFPKWFLERLKVKDSVDETEEPQIDDLVDANAEVIFPKGEIEEIPDDLKGLLGL